jgi:CNT family concentrative nucleoside transporter
MSIPCSLALSKVRVPETEQPVTKGVTQMPTESTEREANLLHAAGNGAIQGIHLCIIIGAVLLAIISLVQFFDTLLAFFGGLVGVPLSFVMLTQYLFYPLAFILGVPSQDCFKVAQLLGTKMLVNEFVAYASLLDLAAKESLSARSIMVATYVSRPLYFLLYLLVVILSKFIL